MLKKLSLGFYSGDFIRFRVHLPFINFHTLYFKRNEFFSAERCYKKIKSFYPQMPNINVIGYSWGGPTALNFVKYLTTRANENPTSLITVDPVKKGLPFVSNALVGSSTLKKNLPLFKGKCVNYYQSKNHSYDLSNAKILKGNKIEIGTQKCKNHEVEINKNFAAHMRIVYQKRDSIIKDVFQANNMSHLLEMKKEKMKNFRTGKHLYMDELEKLIEELIEY